MFLRHADLVLFDEPTSRLDAYTLSRFVVSKCDADNVKSETSAYANSWNKGETV